MTPEVPMLLGVPASPGIANPDLVARLQVLLHGSAAPREEDAESVIAGTSDTAVLAALAELVPEALALQRQAGIPVELSRAGLADIGRKHAAYGVREVITWLLGIMRGDVIEVGRLQVERHPGPHGHALHIPEAGPLTPGAVSDSLQRIQALLAAENFCCTSWLLDPAPSEELPDSNIAHFARRFTILSTTGQDAAPTAGSEAAVKFVFRRPLADVYDHDLVRPTTRLEHLVASRLRSGYVWTEPTGLLINR
jgi:hypothetical protein